MTNSDGRPVTTDAGSHSCPHRPSSPDDGGVSPRFSLADGLRRGDLEDGPWEW